MSEDLMCIYLQCAPIFNPPTRTKVQVKINKTVYTLHVDSVQLTLQIPALKLKTLTYYNENEYKRNKTYCRYKQ